MSSDTALISSVSSRAVIGLAGLILRGWRQQLSLASAACFVVCGILGIFSIGLLFLALAALLIVVAVRTDGPLNSPPAASDSPLRPPEGR